MRQHIPIRSLAAMIIMLGPNSLLTFGQEVLYRVNALRPLPGHTSAQARSINVIGQTAGSSIGNPGNVAVIWSPAQTISPLAGQAQTTHSYAINDISHVAGVWQNDSGDSEAFFWSATEGMIPLGDLPGADNYSAAYGMNNTDQVVGFGRSAAGQEAFIWDSVNGMRGLGDLPGGQFMSIARAINDQGQVVGYSVSELAGEAFIWTEETGMQPIGGDVDGVYAEEAMAINELGQVAGNAYSAIGIQAFFWDPATGIVGLGNLGGGSPRSWGYGINDLGQVVGETRRESFGQNEGFIWDRQNGMRRLSDLLDTSGVSPYAKITSALAINNAGQIVGRSHLSHDAVLLTPFVLADMNCDGSVNQFDIQGFVLTLSNETIRYTAQYPNCHGEWAGDANQDGSINLFDIQPFVELLGG